MTPYTHDYLLVGQGLAGSLLSYKLLQHGFKVHVFDQNHEGSASAVAAGIINPITGHRLNITDKFEQFYKPAIGCYQGLERDFSSTLFHPIAQQRLIKNAGQFNYLQQRQSQPEYSRYLAQYSPNLCFFKASPYGVTEIKQSAYIDVKKILKKVKQHLIQLDSYTEGKFDYLQLKSDEQGVKIGRFYAKGIIFCEGYQAINNPWLSTLPFKLAKGEILTLQTSERAVKNIPMLNWGQWLLATSEQTVKLGSSYAWDDLNLKTSEYIKIKLFESFKRHIQLGEVNTIKHEAGVRPTTLQRKPFIGRLSNLANAFCFNGFGSKGCLLIPYYSDLLIQHCEQDKPLPEELTLHL